MKRSSFHNLTGDTKLSFFGKIIYFIYVFIEKFLLDLYPLKKKKYTSKIDFDKIKLFHGANDLFDFSPQRILANSLIIDLTEKINFSYMLDLGCGTGVYKNYFNNIGKNFSYLGIDIKGQKNNNEILEYDLGPSFPNLENIKDKVDFIFSQSALEHIRYDLEVICWSIEKFPNAKHLHIIPAPMSAICYNLHGFRRYSNYTLKKLTDCFPSNVEIYSIGNSTTRKLYMSYFKNKFKKNHKFEKLFGSENYYNWLENSESLQLTDPKSSGGPEFYALFYDR